jgi:hypothetical protein
MQRALDLPLSTLSTQEISILLDAATILHAKPLEQAMAVWTAWHGDGAQSLVDGLIQKSVLRVDAANMLAMHDALVDHGRDIILHRPEFTEHYGSRLWVEDGTVMGCEQVQCGQCMTAHAA